MYCGCLGVVWNWMVELERRGSSEICGPRSLWTLHQPFEYRYLYQTTSKSHETKGGRLASTCACDHPKQNLKPPGLGRASSEVVWVHAVSMSSFPTCAVLCSKDYCFSFKQSRYRCRRVHATIPQKRSCTDGISKVMFLLMPLNCLIPSNQRHNSRV